MGNDQALVDRVSNLPQDVIELWLAGLNGVSNAARQADEVLRAQMADMLLQQRQQADELQRLRDVLDRQQGRNTYDYLIELIQAVAMLRQQLIGLGVQPCYPSSPA